MNLFYANIFPKILDIYTEFIKPKIDQNKIHFFFLTNKVVLAKLGWNLFYTNILLIF